MADHIGCGIDIGGSGVKGALVDLDSGEFIGERVRIPTPQPSTPKAIAKTCRSIVEQLDVPADIPIGIDMPGPIVHGVVPFIANLDKKWEGTNAEQLFADYVERPVSVLNDADAAGLAEIAFGAAKDHPGTVIVTTLGTGIGSAIVVDGRLVPNTELGHLEINGHDAETQASAAQRTKYDLSWKDYAKRLQVYYSTLEMLFWPDLLVVGGGVSKNHQKFLPLLKLKTPIVPAQLFNTAGIVGAAWKATQDQQSQS